MNIKITPISYSNW